MKYKDWIICDLKATDSLQLLGTANRHDAKFKFQVDLVSLVGGGWDAFVEVVFGVSDTEARSVALDFADERIRGAAQSAIESARDRLNDFIADELEDGKEWPW